MAEGYVAGGGVAGGGFTQVQDAVFDVVEGLVPLVEPLAVDGPDPAMSPAPKLGHQMPTAEAAGACEQDAHASGLGQERGGLHVEPVVSQGALAHVHIAPWDSLDKSDGCFGGNIAQIFHFTHRMLLTTLPNLF